jgi:predicted alpha/beta-fold hydrolase
MYKSKKLNFKPLFGLSSTHLQMITAAYIPKGKAPASHQWLVDIGNGDKLSCELSIPSGWQEENKTIVMIHGLGGSHQSNYMVRMARKLHEKGHKVVRINLRGCGSGKGLSKLPYHAGNSDDILKVIQALKEKTPHSEIYLVGFSLGANTVLKLAGELGPDSEKLVKTFIAICPPFDLQHTVRLIEKKIHIFYRRYFLKHISKQSTPWTSEKFHSLYKFDDKITGPSWGYAGADDYYQKCSSKHFLSTIGVTTHILSAEDDPFISVDPLKNISISGHVHLWTTRFGSHMGFLGRTEIQWLDQLLLGWIEEKQSLPADPSNDKNF